MNSKKGGKTLAIFLVILMIALPIIGFIGGVMVSKGSPTSNQRFIADNITVLNIPYQVEGKPEFVGSNNAVPLASFGVGAPESFAYNTKYGYAEYVYKVQGAPNAYMLIYGAADDGVTYYVVIVSVSMHQLRITTPLETITLDNDNARHMFVISVNE